MDPSDLIKKLLGLSPDTSEWTKVTKLTPEDFIKSRALETEVANIDGEIRVLQSKQHVLKAQVVAKGSEWWEYIHKQYNLPRNNSYTIGDEGYILMEPREKKEG